MGSKFGGNTLILHFSPSRGRADLPTLLCLDARGRVSCEKSRKRLVKLGNRLVRNPNSATHIARFRLNRPRLRCGLSIDQRILRLPLCSLAKRWLMAAKNSVIIRGVISFHQMPPRSRIHSTRILPIRMALRFPMFCAVRSPSQTFNPASTVRWDLTVGAGAGVSPRLILSCFSASKRAWFIERVLAERCTGIPFSRHWSHSFAVALHVAAVLCVLASGRVPPVDQDSVPAFLRCAHEFRNRQKLDKLHAQNALSA